MYKRHLAHYIAENAQKYPVIILIGPRQSGKSTLCRMVFPSYAYVSLEDVDQRRRAIEDPRGFFRLHSGPLVLDEVQRAPELLSYIQTLVDEPASTRKFVLTGSHQLLLMEKITQSLAGRTVIAKLLPFSRRELENEKSEIPIGGELIVKEKQQTHSTQKRSLETQLFTGGYPRIYDKQLAPQQWLQQYYETYVERDVRTLMNIGDVDLFDRFVRLCAGRVGQLLNLSSLGNDCGVSQPTANAWLSLLKMSFLCFTLQPHFRNFNKRMIKSPKLYFFDTGLLCYLLKIQTAEMIQTHPLRGFIFENWIISEWMKSYYHRGLEPPLYFWRDTKGNEVDLIIDQGTVLYPITIKSAETFDPSFLKPIDTFQKLQGLKQKDEPLGECVYGGEETFSFKNSYVRSWNKV